MSTLSVKRYGIVVVAFVVVVVDVVGVGVDVVFVVVCVECCCVLKISIDGAPGDAPPSAVNIS